jgi:exopolysaccharide biosynthesis polyprenyl glycosylphosphotransferase
MFHRAGSTLRLTLVAVDLGLTGLALYLARLLRLLIPIGTYLSEPLQFTGWFYLLIPAIWLSVFISLRVYSPGRALRYAADLQSLWGAVTMTMLVFTGIAYLFFRDLSRLLLVYFYLLDLLFLTIWRVSLPRLLRQFQGLGQPRRVLVVGAGKVGHDVGEVVQEHRWAGLELVGFVDDDPGKQRDTYLGCPVFGPLESINSIVTEHKIEEVVIALPPRAQSKIEQLVLAMQALPVNVRLVPDIFSMVLIRASVEDFAGIPLIGLREPMITGLERALKRAFDLTIAVLALIGTAPVMISAAIAIKMDSPGPVFFCQKRIGENGRPFEMLKFRTMIEGAEEEEQTLARESERAGPPVFEKRPDDPRITQVGHVLRRWSLDELPQLINVLKGEMSLVGPRPELPWLVEQYDLWQRKRFAVPQGMTGWWQVNGRSERAEHDLRVEDDLYYIRNWSIWLDLRILLMTVGAVIRGEGAY